METCQNSDFNKLPQDVQDCVNNIIKNKNFTTHNVEGKNISTGGNNFLGELYEININGQTDKGNKCMNLFLKLIIENDDFRIYSIPEVYAKEVFVYLELSKMFDKLQIDANVPLAERFNFIQSYDETNYKCIVLENATKRAYKIMPRMELMSVEFARLSIAQLAKFHALSFALEKQNPNYYETKIKIIKQSFVYDKYWNDLLKKTYEISVSKLDKETRARVDKFFELSLEKYPKYMNGVNFKTRCLCHGDYKMNNILFKEENGHVTDVIPIDYQQIYYGSPVIDLIYFIYAASDREFREANNFKDHYYTTFKTFLNYFNISAETVWPAAEFEECFTSSLDYALMYTLYMLPMFYVVGEEPSGKDDVMELALQVDDRFHVRMREIIDEFIDMNVI